jgi:uncharacterized protein with gpF-like domain
MLEEGDDPEKTAKAFLSASEERDAYWFAFEGQRERWYGKVEKRVAKLIGDDLEAAAAVADRGLSAMENAIEQRAGLWRKELEGTWDQIAQEFGKRTHDGLVKAAHGGQEFKAWDWGRSAREYIRERVRDRVSAIVETTKGWVGRRVREANMPDDGGDAGQNIRDQAPEYSKTRGATIGQTEVLGASGYGSNLGANRSGAVKNKIWLTSRDDRVRDSHRTLEGQKRPLDQPYSNGLMFPGDPTGPPSETIKCRCVELYEV